MYKGMEEVVIIGITTFGIIICAEVYFVFSCSICMPHVEQTHYICFSLKHYLKVKHLAANVYIHRYKQFRLCCFSHVI